MGILKSVSLQISRDRLEQHDLEVSHIRSLWPKLCVICHFTRYITFLKVVTLSKHKQKSEGEEIFTFKKREKFKLKMIVCSLIYAILFISFSSASVNLLLPMHETEKLLGKYSVQFLLIGNL